MRSRGVLIGRGLIQKRLGREREGYGVVFGFEGMSFEVTGSKGRCLSGAVRKLPEVILDSSMVEHAAVNRGVVGSSPTRGVKCQRDDIYESP